MRTQFSAVINCIDGRIQQAVLDYMREEYGFPYVDMITEPGPCEILSRHENSAVVENIIYRMDMAVQRHDVNQCCLIIHEDCAANPVDRKIQEKQARRAWEFLAPRFPEVKIDILWVELSGRVEKVTL